MAKSPTQWGNNDVKNPVLVAPVGKNLDGWATDISKNPTQYQPRTKNTAGWSPEHALQTYFFDDPKFTFDSPLTNFDTLVNGNSINQRGQTGWSAS